MNLNAVARIDTTDIICLVAYFIVLLGVALFGTYLLRRTRGTSVGYFLAARSIGWPAIGLSTWASNMGAPAVMGIAGSAAHDGVAIAIYEWHAIFMLLLLAWCFAPVYRSSDSRTMPEYLEKRFKRRRLRIYFAVLSIVYQLICAIPIELYAGFLFIKLLLPGVDIYVATVGLLVITGVYSVLGGIGAVMYADVLQSAVIIIGTIYVAVESVSQVGGISQLFHRYRLAISNETASDPMTFACGMPHPRAFHMMRPVNDATFPWTGLVFGLTVNAGFYWITNQAIVQRSLASRSLNDTKAGAVLAGYLKLLPFPMFVLPGMAARVLYPDIAACSSPEECSRICDNPSGCSNLSFALLVLRLETSGVKGIIMASLLAALMSSLTALFSSASSMFTLDIYRHLKPLVMQRIQQKNQLKKSPVGRVNDRELVIVGRCFAAVLVALSIGWMPILERLQGSTLWDYMQRAISCLTPPMFAVFVMGVFWRRTTEAGAFFGCAVGTLFGAAKLIADFQYAAPACGSSEPDERPWFVKDIVYIHFSALLFVVTVIAAVGRSLLDRPMTRRQLARVTFADRRSSEPIWTGAKSETDDETSAETGDTPHAASGSIIAKLFPSMSKDTIEKLSRSFDFVCGFNQIDKADLGKTGSDTIEKENGLIAFEKSSPFMNVLLDMNGVLAGAVCLFLWTWMA